MYSLFDELKAAIAGEPAHRPLIVCGAGIALATSGNRAPGWKSLIADAVARLESLDPTGSSLAWAEAARDRLRSADAAELVTLADEVTLRFGGKADAEFASWLEGMVGHLPCLDPTLIEAIASLGCPIATTNYDDLISRLTHRREISWSDHSGWLRVLSSDPTSGILHLHGHWRDPAHVVLGLRSYTEYSADERRDFIQKMALLHRPTVFVGCSEDGLSDPDFARLSAWIQAMNDLVQRRYWLVPDSHLRPPDPATRLYSLAYGPKYTDLPAFVRKLAPIAVDDLPPDPHMIGRSGQLKTVTSAVLAAERAIVIPGGPGMGKTTLALAAAHTRAVVDRFAEYRRFVALDSRRSSHDLLTGLCISLGRPASGGAEALFKSITSACAAAPWLVILDNLETPLEADTSAVEATLARLMAIPGLSLILTVRGLTPRLPAARVLSDVQAMTPDEAEELFLRWAHRIDRTDPDLPSLLQALDGHALSIVLLARLAEGQHSLSLLRSAYEKERVNLLRSGKADHRLLSTRVSLRLSLQSPLMTEEAIGAIDLLANSPGGLDQQELEESLDVLPGGFHVGALTLLNLRLVEQRSDRLYMLAPLREAVIEEIRDGFL